MSMLIAGRLWTEDEETRRADVVVLGHDAAADLFQNEDPIGKEIECDGDVFTVIGVFDKFPQPFGGGRNTQDNSAFFPVATFRKIHPEIKDYWLGVKYDDAKNKALVTDEIRELLRRRRKVRVEQDDNFAIFGPDSLSRLWNSLTSGLFLFMVAVSSVGLDGRRRRRDEHHAGLGHGANARNRRPQSHRRDQSEHPAAVHRSRR